MCPGQGQSSIILPTWEWEHMRLRILDGLIQLVKGGMDGSGSMRGPSRLKNIQKLVLWILHVFNQDIEGPSDAVKQVLVLARVIRRRKRRRDEHLIWGQGGLGWYRWLRQCRWRKECYG